MASCGSNSVLEVGLYQTKIARDASSRRDHTSIDGACLEKFRSRIRRRRRALAFLHRAAGSRPCPLPAGRRLAQRHGTEPARRCRIALGRDLRRFVDGRGRDRLAAGGVADCDAGAGCAARHRGRAYAQARRSDIDLEHGVAVAAGYRHHVLSMLFLPIQAAVGIGVALSALLYLSESATDVSLVGRVERPDGSIEERRPPPRLPLQRRYRAPRLRPSVLVRTEFARERLWALNRELTVRVERRKDRARRARAADRGTGARGTVLPLLHLILLAETTSRAAIGGRRRKGDAQAALPPGDGSGAPA